jgi:putative glutathione S-transferase
MIARVIKRLEGLISISFVEPIVREHGWTFAEQDPLTGARYIHELYTQADPLYTGRATVPVLWDKHSNTIVNNESADILRMFNSEFDEINERIYETVNNGVYKAGFATTQRAHETAVYALFESLDWLEERLQRERYLLGDLLTEADWRLFPTLVRFDAVYYGHFKCNLRHVYEYSALWDYTRDLYQMPGIAATVSIEDCKSHYYSSHPQLDPTGILPLGPMLDFSAPHHRDA